MIKLNLGCGKDIRGKYINVDYVRREGVDKVFNLNEYPFPRLCVNSPNLSLLFTQN